MTIREANSGYQFFLRNWRSRNSKRWWFTARIIDLRPAANNSVYSSSMRNDKHQSPVPEGTTLNNVVLSRHQTRNMVKYDEVIIFKIHFVTEFTRYFPLTILHWLRTSRRKINFIATELKEWESGWVSEWAGEWVSGLGDWMSEYVSERVGWVGVWVGGWLGGWGSGWLSGWASGWVGERCRKQAYKNKTIRYGTLRFISVKPCIYEHFQKKTQPYSVSASFL
jgi:hypothetical protein